VKLLINVLLSLALGALCVWSVVRDMDAAEVLRDLLALPASGVLLFLITQAVTHLFRAWRWKYLLRPIGVYVPFGRLMAISSVGFMAILALPFRLGELVRPYLVKRTARARMSAVLGTVAVERIIDGLLISIVFFVSYAASSGDSYAALEIAAWVSLLGFLGLTLFLGFALHWPEATIRFALRASLLTALAPRFAGRVGEKVRQIISGFRVLGDPRNLIPFILQSLLYWGTNGFGMWILAQRMGLPASLGAAFAAMSFTGVVLSLPNPPGNIGSFHAGVKLALLAYLPAEIFASKIVAYAVVLHGLAMLWYVGLGLAALPFTGSPTSLGETLRESKQAATETEAEAA